MEDIFAVGTVACGDCFFGREEEIKSLNKTIFRGSGAVHLVGSTRIGKTSLVNAVYNLNAGRKDCLRIKISMAECTDATDFWYSFLQEIQRELSRLDAWNDAFEKSRKEIPDPFNADDAGWYKKFRLPFQDILRRIRELKFKVVLTVDDFDYVVQRFQQNAYYYQLLASIYSEPQYPVSGVLITRRRLHLLEAECPHISTFHGRFDERPLRVFSARDMEKFYEQLLYCNIEISDAGKETLEYCTGRMPGLCCLFGQRMTVDRDENDTTVVRYDADDIKNIFRRCLPQIDRHYEDLIRNLKRDSYLEFIFYLSVDSKLPNLTGRDIENMKQMGILVADDTKRDAVYYAFSKDFMTYFKSKPLNLPVWETITACEKRLKGIFGRAFPELRRVTYANLIGADAENFKWRIKRLYPEVDLNWNQIIRFGKDLSMRKNPVTILDVLTLPYIINVIINNWDNKFLRYFGGDRVWIEKLKLIRDVRNPAAHAQLECIDKEELANCLQYCEDIIRMGY